MIDPASIPVTTLLPQRPPFIMVDALTLYDENVAETIFVVKKENLFCRNGKFSEAGIVENVAQTCAARIGYINKILNNRTVKLGIIGAIRNLEINFLPRTGDTLRTRIEIKSEVFSMSLVEARVECGGRLAASCEMKIALTDFESDAENQ